MRLGNETQGGHLQVPVAAGSSQYDAGAALWLSSLTAPGLWPLTNYFQACTPDICKLLIRATREKSRREREAKLHH